jgi:hypothetical protein
MDSLHLVEYMGWVPIVGSAFGNLLGGFVSDHFVGAHAAKEDEDGEGSEGDKDATRGRLLSGSINSPRSATSRGTGSGQGAAHAALPTVVATAEHSLSFDSAVSLARPVDQSVRMLIAGLSNLLPVPLIVCALLAEFPYCFLIMIASGMVSVSPSVLNS